MIVSSATDPGVRAALRLAARADEDVVLGGEDARVAVRHGFPRLLVETADEPWQGSTRDAAEVDVPVLPLSRGQLATWKASWRSEGLPRSWPENLARHVRPLTATRARPGRAERTLGDLARLAGGPLPPDLQGLARRVLERPFHYAGLDSLSPLTGVSAGALKARFRRREMDSPFVYLRWFRCLALADLLRDGGLNTREVANRLGWSSSGNLCRFLDSVAGMTPTDVRRADGWEVVLVRFARAHLGADALAGWRSLDELFLTGTG